MSRFETEILTQRENLAFLTNLPGVWVDRVHKGKPPKQIILDMDSSVSPTYGNQEGSAYNGYFECTCYHPLFCLNQFGDMERTLLRSGNVHSADDWQSALEPVIARYRGYDIPRFFRGDVAFADPHVYRFLETEGYFYAIRLKANQILGTQSLIRSETCVYLPWSLNSRRANMTAKDTRFVLVAFCLCLASMALGRNTPTVRWGHQPIADTYDVPRAAVAGSDGGIYLVLKRESKDASGATTSKNLFLLKYNQEGEQLWSRPFAPGLEDPLGLTPDGNGNIYVFGHVSSTDERQTKGKYDGFYAMYDKAGNQLWIRLMGTVEHDVCTGLDFDTKGNLYISGYTYGDFAKPNEGEADMFIAAYDKDGTLLWRDQIGTAARERAGNIRVGDNDDVYLCGDTPGSLARQNNGQMDFVVARYDRTGKRLWLHQYGTNAFDTVMSMEIGELGHLYLGCRTNGNVGTRNPQRQDLDSCLVRISNEGKLLWARQFGPAGWDGTWDMARFVDGSGDVLISGCQIPLRGKCQAYSRRYSPEGELVWTQEFRKKSAGGGTCGRVVAIDSDNNCYQAGWTHADLFGVNNGTANMFIVRFDDAKDEPVSP